MVIELGRLNDEVKATPIKKKDGTDSFVLFNTLSIYAGRNETTIIPIVAWGNEAVFIARNFIRNDEIYITGTLQNQTNHSHEPAIILKVSSSKRVFGRKIKHTEED